MRDIATIVKRELGAYFYSPIAYIVAIIFVTLNAGLYLLTFWGGQSLSMRAFFEFVSWSVCIILPAITMRLWAEEKRGNTYELLLTFPMPSHRLVAGKYLAALLFYLFCLAGSLPIPIALNFLGKDGGPDWGPIATAYLGSLLLGALLLALGLFISGFVRDQIVAFILTLILALSMKLIGFEPVTAYFNSLAASTGLPLIGNLASFLRDGFSFSMGFESLGRGLVDLGDLVFFLIWTGVLLFLNGLYLEGRLRPGFRGQYALALVLGLAVPVLAGSLAQGHLPRLDLTAERIYSLSSAAGRILNEIDAEKKVRLKVYISPREELPAGMQTLERDLLERLAEFRRASGDRLVIETVHLHADEAILRAQGKARGAETDQDKGKVEEDLLRSGIVPFYVRSGGVTGSETKVIYSTLALTYGAAKKEILPQVLPEVVQRLESELLPRVWRLIHERTPKVGLLAPIQALPAHMVESLRKQLGGMFKVPDEQDNYQTLMQLLLQNEQYEVRRLRPEDHQAIPDDLDALIWIQPEALNDRQRWELARFVRRGGELLVAAQLAQLQFSARPGGGAPLPFFKRNETGLEPLLNEYGFQLEAKMVLNPEAYAIDIQSGFYKTTLKVRNIFSQDITHFARETSLARGIASPFLMNTAAPLRAETAKLESLGLKLLRALEGPKAGWAIPIPSGAAPNFDDPRPADGPHLLAGLLSGSFPDVYAGKPRPKWPEAPKPANGSGEAAEPEHPDPESAPMAAAPGQLFLLGSATGLTDDQIRDQTGHWNWQAQLLVNALEAVCLGEDIMRLNAGGARPRPLREDIDNKAWYFFLMVFLAPLLIALLALERFQRRRSRRRTYEESLR